MEVTYFPREPLCSWLSILSSWWGRFVIPDLLCELMVPGAQAWSVFTGKSALGALQERMLWVETVSFNFSTLNYLIPIVCYFLKWAFTSVVSRIILTWAFLVIITFTGTFCGEVPSAAVWLLLLTAYQFTDEETEEVLWGVGVGLIYKVRVNVQGVWDEACDTSPVLGCCLYPWYGHG